MTLLDRYIARLYLLNTMTLFLLLSAFVVMVDVSLNLSRFVAAAQRMMETSGYAGTGGVRRVLITLLLVADLWWPRLLQLFNFVAGLVLVGAMGFTFAQLVRHREMVAVLAGGISLPRAARPVVLVACVVLGLQVLNQELVMPRIAHLLTRDAADAGQREVASFSVKLTTDAQRRLWQAGTFDPARGVLQQVNIWERDEQGRAVRRIHADAAAFTGAGQWRLENPRVVNLSLARGPGAVPGPSGTPGARTGPQAPETIQSDLDPTTLLAGQFSAFSQSLSWGQMSRVLSTTTLKPDVRERMERLAWGRASGLVCSLLALLIALPFFLTREPVNMVAQSLKCAPLAIGSVMLGVLGSAAIIPGLPPSVGAFVPVMILLPLSVAAVTSIRT
jgi:lipopolysaccharide export system permease protein